MDFKIEMIYSSRNSAFDARRSERPYDTDLGLRKSKARSSRRIHVFARETSAAFVVKDEGVTFWYREIRCFQRGVSISGLGRPLDETQ